jgi:hypothetical protein
VTVQDWIVTVDEVVSSGIEGNAILRLKIYPNPFSEQAIIEVNNPEQSTLNLSIYSVLGSKVFEKEILRSDTFELKKGDLWEGIYMMVLKGDSFMENKIIIVH